MNIEYKDRLVTFIDVLGFKNLVYADNKKPISEYYKFLLSNFKTAVAKREFDFLLISDSIVVYCENTSENLSELIKLANILQAGLLARGIIVRGAISHGNLFVNKENNIIVGKGLINAYSLEAAAKYPRIIIDRSLIAKFYGATDDILSKNNVAGLAHVSIERHNGAASDYPYLSYGRILGTSVSKIPYEGALTLLKENYYKNEHTEKFEWLKGHLIHSIEMQLAHFDTLPKLNKNEKNRKRHATHYLALFRAL